MAPGTFLPRIAHLSRSTFASRELLHFKLTRNPMPKFRKPAWREILWDCLEAVLSDVHWGPGGIWID